MMKQKKILIVYTKRSSFVREDIDIISSKYQVEEYHFKPKKDIVGLAWEFIKQFLFLCINSHKYTHYYIWFADFQGFLPALFSNLFNKKLIVVLGGYDTAAIKEIDYGIFLKNDWRTKIAKKIISLSDYLLGVDQTMFYGENYFFRSEGMKAGVDVFVKNIKAKKIVVPTGYDFNKWQAGKIPKEDMILTIGAVETEKAFLIKGFDLFIEVAKLMPHYQFVIIGLNDFFKSKVDAYQIKNLTTYGFCSQDFILKMAAKAKIYCQLSMSEGLPNALCEAMLCGCIPIGSNVNGVPLAINNPNLLVQKKNVNEVIEKINFAYSIEESEISIFRDRIIELFPKQRRINAIEELLKNQ